MNKEEGGEKRVRTLVRTLSYRMWGTATTMALTYLSTGSWKYAGIIGGGEVVSKIFLQYAHERAWDKIAWGRNGIGLDNKLEDYSI